MSKPTDNDMDAIDEMIAGITGFLGVILERGRPRYVGVRALVESTVYALVEHTQATTPAPSQGITPLAVAELLYEYASDKWAQQAVTAVISAGMVTTPDEGEALAAWLAEKQVAEREECANWDKRR